VSKFFFLLAAFCFNSALSINAQAVQDSVILKVSEFILCRDVIEREPFEPVSTFTLENNKAWVFARVYNSNGLTDLSFKWYLNDELISEVPVKIGNSSNWRTYSNSNLQKGFWRVELQTADSLVLSELRFNVSD
jgi:hypothetical protein